MHLRTKQDLVQAVIEATDDRSIRRCLQHKYSLNLGRFKGGYVILTGHEPIIDIDAGWLVVGAKLTGMPPTFTVGRLRAVPWADYIGGFSNIDMGDRPDECLRRQIAASVRRPGEEKLQSGEGKRNTDTEHQPLDPDNVIGQPHK